MQIIQGYNKSDNVSRTFRFRLFYMSHPRLKDWRKTRHQKEYQPDTVEKLVIDLFPQKQVVALDCAGWVLKHFGFQVQSFESDVIAQHYDSNCCIEPDLFSHRPTYTKNWPVLTRYPWYLRYAKIPDLINFLELWTQSVMILNFHERYVQHNYLKYQLIDLVQPLTNLNIDKVADDIWVVRRDH